jgi:hypothetical protein
MSDKEDFIEYINNVYAPKPEKYRVWYDDNFEAWYGLILQKFNGNNFFYLLTRTNDGEVVMEIELTPEFQKLYPKFINGGK